METVATESADFLTSKITNYTDLPAGAKKRVKDYANAGGNAWTAANLATPQWKVIFAELVDRRVAALNTPKHEQLKNLFNHFFNVPDIEAFWAPDTKSEIDDFVSLRGEVAHRGAESRYIHFQQLERFEKLVSTWVRLTDRALSDHLRTLVAPPRRPWSRVT